ncbi:MAG: hypothetical protein IKR69_07445 [Bacteroidales bacterium]|nr:hypothetical protein [Bacteroidales bacterium]
MKQVFIFLLCALLAFSSCTPDPKIEEEEKEAEQQLESIPNDGQGVIRF